MKHGRNFLSVSIVLLCTISHPTVSFEIYHPRSSIISRRAAVPNGNDAEVVDIASSALDNISYGGLFESSRGMLSRPYVSPVLQQMDDSSRSSFLMDVNASKLDPLWEQVKLEAMETLENEPSAGPQVYTLILSQINLIGALTSIVSHEIETELIPATSLKNLFMEMLDPVEDRKAISLDVMKSAMRSSSDVDGTVMTSILFNQGLHALVRSIYDIF
jgi:hypothetical protein